MRCALWIGISMLLVSGCDKSADEGSDKPAAAEGSNDEKAETTKKEKASKAKRPSKDRGEASVQIGETAWQAKRARAKLKNSQLTINASRMDFADKRASRQQLTLVVADYKGPGTYPVRGAGSMFIGVGFDTPAMKKSDTDEKQTKEAVKALSSAKTIFLMKATLTVESDDGTQIVGTFSQPALGKYPALTDGKFRALITSK